MKGEHTRACIRKYPSCLCTRCKHDHARLTEEACCDRYSCPVDDCPNFEPDDEEEGEN